MILSFYHGLIVYITTSVGFMGPINGKGITEDMWFSSTIAFSTILHIVTYKIYVEILFMNHVVFWAGFLSLLIYWLMVICMSTNGLAPYFNSQI